jgi:hypothetical protein
MQILTSGSFVNLDNQEKIDALVFTAKAIADSAVQTDGFQSDEENNKRLALEIWQGADYMTREHERARVQNIFVGNFLDRLREIAPAAAATNESSEILETAAKEISSSETDESKDEFLGFVTTENESLEVSDVNQIPPNAEASKSDENLSLDVETAGEFQEEIAEPETNQSAEILTAEKSAENPIAETPESEIIQPEIVESVEPKRELENKISDASETEQSEKQAISAISLPEKEPYRWDDCTVTAMIQLLPTDSGKRRAVVSIRTHDFAPQISVIELEGAATPEKIAPALFASFERYKTDLPVKVMDKMKREKTTSKKQASSKTNAETKTIPESVKPSVEKPTQNEVKAVEKNLSKPANTVAKSAAPAVAATTPAASQAVSANPAKPSAKTSKVETGAQGSLFDF